MSGGATVAADCSEWEDRASGSRQYNVWAAPLIFGEYVWLDDHIGKVSYTLTASPVAQGAVITGEVKYANGVNFTNTQFASSVYFTTGNAVASVEARFKNNNPTGVTVNGTIYC